MPTGIDLYCGTITLWDLRRTLALRFVRALNEHRATQFARRMSSGRFHLLVVGRRAQRHRFERDHRAVAA